MSDFSREEILFHESLMQPIYDWNPHLKSDKGVISNEACKKKMERNEVCHIFPTVSLCGGSEEVAKGIMIPFSLTAHKEWYVADSLGNLSKTTYVPGVTAQDDIPYQLIFKLLDVIAFNYDTQDISCPPLSLMQPYRLELDIPLHISMIDGRSMDLPLVVALLREWAAIVTDSGPLWGHIPLFCTGAARFKENKDIHFDADDVLTKYQGFIKAFGHGKPCLLTYKQFDILSKENEIKKYSDSVILFDGTLSDLIKKTPFQELGIKLKTYTIPATSQESMPLLVDQLYYRTAFNRAKRILDWLVKPDIDLPPMLAFKTRQQLALCVLHGGDLCQSHNLNQKLDECWKNQLKPIAGLDDVAEFYLNRGSYFHDSLDTLCYLKDYETELECNKDLISLKNRYKLYGQLCQNYLAARMYEKSITYGELALKNVIAVSRKEELRTRNYLIHANLALGRAHGKVEFLQKAEQLLECGEKSLCDLEGHHHSVDGKLIPPRSSYNAYFRAYYRCEILRCLGKAADDISTTVDPPHNNTWTHPYYFMYYSLLRNPKTDCKTKKIAVNEIKKLMQTDIVSSQTHTVLSLLYRIMVLYAYSHSKKHNLKLIIDIKNGLKYFSDQGLTAWESRLKLLLTEFQNDECPEKLEPIFDALPFF